MITLSSYKRRVIRLLLRMTLLHTLGNINVAAWDSSINGTVGCPCLFIGHPAFARHTGTTHFFAQRSVILHKEQNNLGRSDKVECVIAKLKATGQYFCYPPTYGMNGCAKYDVDKTPFCATRDKTPIEGAYDWCDQPWCYIDPDNCDQKSFKTMVMKAYPDGQEPYYSYATCGGVDTDITKFCWNYGNCDLALVVPLMFLVKLIIIIFATIQWLQRNPNGYRDIKRSCSTAWKTGCRGMMILVAKFCFNTRQSETKNGDTRLLRKMSTTTKKALRQFVYDPPLWCVGLDLVYGNVHSDQYVTSSLIACGIFIIVGGTVTRLEYDRWPGAVLWLFDSTGDDNFEVDGMIPPCTITTQPLDVLLCSSPKIVDSAWKLLALIVLCFPIFILLTGVANNREVKGAFCNFVAAVTWWSTSFLGYKLVKFASVDFWTDLRAGAHFRESWARSGSSLVTGTMLFMFAMRCLNLAIQRLWFADRVPDGEIRRRACHVHTMSLLNLQPKLETMNEEVEVTASTVVGSYKKEESAVECKMSKMHPTCNGQVEHATSKTSPTCRYGENPGAFFHHLMSLLETDIPEQEVRFRVCVAACAILREEGKKKRESWMDGKAEDSSANSREKDSSANSREKEQNDNKSDENMLRMKESTPEPPDDGYGGTAGAKDKKEEEPSDEAA